MNVALLGVSTDDVKSQKEFSDKYHLPFSLLSDPDGAIASKYGSFKSFGSMRFASRHTFIIDPDGNIARIYRNVSPKKHSDEIIADLKTLGADSSQKSSRQ
jgi:peroxiredoxin Q/BCP